MTKIKTFIHDIYPRSPELIQVSREVVRKLRQETEITKQAAQDFDSLLKLQQSLHMDFIEDGKLSWQDIFRPIVEATEGLETGALTRWFDNNCFFRQPVLTGILQLDEKKLDAFFSSITPQETWKVTLLSPFTFAKLTLNETNASFADVLTNSTAILAKAMKYLEQRGVAFVQFNEPYIPYHGANFEEIKLFRKTLEQLHEAKNNLRIAFHFYFGNAAPIITALKKSDFIDTIGVDFYKTVLTDLPKEFPYELAVGILDGRNSLLENEESLKEFVEKVIKTVPSEVVYITNNSDLDLLPETIARQKVALLAKIRDAF